VGCADCHVGEGAAHFVEAKLRGARQLWQFVRNDIRRPAPQPTDVLAVNCARCHSSEKYTEDRLRIARHYSDDEKAVEKTSVWRMRVGGLRDGAWSGAHTHNGMKVTYLADKSRQTIAAVKVTRADGSTDTYEAKEVAAPPGAQWFEMGCTDCHNRAGHDFKAPEQLVDAALGRGAIDKQLPFIRKAAIAALSKPYASSADAAKQLPAELSAFYAAAHAEKPQLDAVATLLAQAWSQNNFPQMNVTGASYRNYLQHEPGCYRCHDKNHVDSKGASIQKKCAGTCHDLIADHEESPEVMEVLFP
jgi:hypothetical protein